MSENRNLNDNRLHVNDLGDQRIVERSARGGWRWWWAWLIIVGLAVWWAGWGWAGTGGWWWGHPARHGVVPPSVGPNIMNTPTHPGALNSGMQKTLPPATEAQATLPRAPSQMIEVHSQPVSAQGSRILAAKDKLAFIGKHFAANDVPVAQLASNRAMWIGKAQPMLAVLGGKANTKALAAGTVVNAVGTVEKAPPEAQAQNEWKLTDEDAAHLEREGAYIQVSKLTVPPQ